MTTEQVTSSNAVGVAKAAAANPERKAAPRMRPKKPDFDERDKKVEKLQEKKDELQKRSKEISKRLDTMMNATKSNSKLESLKRDLADVRYLKQQQQKRRDNAIEKINAFTAAKSGVSSAVKKGVNVASPDDIVSAMSTVQARMATMSDAEELRRAHEQLQKLHASYTQLSAEKDAPGQAHSDRIRAELQTEIDTCKEELKKLWTREDALRHELDTMRSEQSASEPDIQALKAERDQCKEIANEIWSKVVEIRDEFQRQFEEFKTNMDLWRAESDEVRKVKNAERAEEMKQRDAERKTWELETRGAPFTTEIIRCDQLLVWCQQYAKQETAAAATEVADAPQALDGMVVMSKKNIEDDDAFSGLSKAKGKKKNGKKAVSAAAAEAKAASQKIQLDIEALGMFSKMRLPVPGTVADIPALVEKVKSKKDEYLGKQKRALAGEEVENEVEEEPPAAPSSSKAAVPKGSVSVDLRCDEAFGTVLLELCVH